MREPYKNIIIHIKVYNNRVTKVAWFQGFKTALNKYIYSGACADNEGIAIIDNIILKIGDYCLNENDFTVSERERNNDRIYYHLDQLEKALAYDEMVHELEYNPHDIAGEIRSIVLPFSSQNKRIIYGKAYSKKYLRSMKPQQKKTICSLIKESRNQILSLHEFACNLVSNSSESGKDDNDNDNDNDNGNDNDNDYEFVNCPTPKKIKKNEPFYISVVNVKNKQNSDIKNLVSRYHTNDKVDFLPDYNEAEEIQNYVPSAWADDLLRFIWFYSNKNNFYNFDEYEDYSSDDYNRISNEIKSACSFADEHLENVMDYILGRNKSNKWWINDIDNMHRYLFT